MYHVKEVGIDELEIQEWNDLLSKSEVCAPLQTYEWAQALRNSMDVEPCFLIAQRRGKTIGGVMCLRKKMFGFLDSYEIEGGPLYVERNKSVVVLRDILRAFRKKKTRSVFTLFVPSPRIGYILREVFEAEGYHALPLYTIVIDLEKPIQEVWRALKKDARKGVRKAERSGVNVEIADDWQEWEEYYKIYLLHSIKKHYSANPHGFFEEMYKLNRKNLCRLFVAKYDGRIVAGKLCLVQGGDLVSIQSASLEAFLAYKPNNLVQWRSIEWAAENGVTAYHFRGLPEKTAYLHGEYEYKRRWGGYVQPHYHYFSSRVASVGVRMIRTSFFAWKLFSRLRNYRIVQI